MICSSVFDTFDLRRSEEYVMLVGLEGGLKTAMRIEELEEVVRYGAFSSGYLSHGRQCCMVMCEGHMWSVCRTKLRGWVIEKNIEGRRE